ncbi:MAG: M48 family metalloprotease, partial [Bacteroidales bacterium]|nr:M48 family metalloprotease [Bacteroidales bacterium]
MKFIRYRLLFLLLFVSIIQQAQDYTYDKKIGAESAVQVEQMIGIYQDSALTAYVNAVGQRLVNVLVDTPLEFRFFVVDMAEPNAFALPGGYIYVSRGLLSLVNDEAELACVIGHEMIHVIKRHAVKQMRKSILPGLLYIPGAVVGVFNSSLGSIINTPVSLGSELFLSNYSRKQENESDKLGIKLASQAGYNPEKLAIILTSLSEDAKLLSGEAEKRSYFSSHPFTPKRVEKIEKEILKLQWSEKSSFADDKMSLYSKLAGMVYGQNPKQGIFEENVFKHPELNLAIPFPEKWNTINVPVAVGAKQPDGEAQLIFMIDNSGGEPDSLGKALTERLQKEYKMKP